MMHGTAATRLSFIPTPTVTQHTETLPNHHPEEQMADLVSLGEPIVSQ